MGNLKDILVNDANGKPRLNLIPLEKTGVNASTREEYNELMRVCESGEWIWNSCAALPTDKYHYWNDHKGKTCVDVEGMFGYGSKNYFLKENYKVITPQEFYRIQKITPEILKEINKYFERKK